MTDRDGDVSTFRRSVKGLLGHLIYRSGLHRLLLRRKAVIAVFHRVQDDLPGNPITCSRAELSAYLEFFDRHFEVVSLGDLLDRLDSGQDVSGCLAITFDDGYRDNFTAAAPELERRNLPATFFVVTEFIETDAVPWWDEERGIVPTWMTWDEVRALRLRGFEVGAHTMTHADLGRTHGHDAEREIRGSKERLDEELGAETTLFTYPYGRPDQMTDENRERVRAAGLRCSPSAHGGLVRQDSDPYRLKRSPVTQWHRSPAHWGFEILRDG